MKVSEDYFLNRYMSSSESTNSSQPSVDTTEGDVGKNPIKDQGVKVVLLDTPEQLVEHAKKILQDAKKSEWKDVPIDKKLEAFQDKYKEFEFYYDVKESLGEGTSSFVKKCINKETLQIFAVNVST